MLPVWAPEILRSHPRRHRVLRGPLRQVPLPRPEARVACWPAAVRRHRREPDRSSACPDLLQSAICAARGRPRQSSATAPRRLHLHSASSFVVRIEIPSRKPPLSNCWRRKTPALNCKPWRKPRARRQSRRLILFRFTTARRQFGPDLSYGGLRSLIPRDEGMPRRPGLRPAKLVKDLQFWESKRHWAMQVLHHQAICRLGIDVKTAATPPDFSAPASSEQLPPAPSLPPPLL